MAENRKSKDVTPDEDKDGQDPVTTEGRDTSGDKENNDAVVTQQPKKNDNSASGDENGDDEEKKSSFKKEGPSAEIEIDPLSEDGCISASAGVGSISKEYKDGAINAEYVGPNVSCVMSCADCPNIVTDCTLELCSANYLLGLILCKVGLAFDTKLIWTEDGVEAEALGTGFDSSEGLAIGALGMKIGIADIEKRKKKWAKKKLRWQKKKVAPESTDVKNGNEGENAGVKDAEAD